VFTVCENPGSAISNATANDKVIKMFLFMIDFLISLVGDE
jgi:hypothetical protein